MGILSTYDELVVAVENYIEREDLVDVIPMFIRLAEISIQQDTDLRLRMTESETTGLSMVAGTDHIDMPADMIECRWIRADYSGRAGNLSLVSQEKFNVIRANDDSGKPQAYLHRGMEIALAPTPTATHGYDIGGYYGITALSEANATNYILTNFPNAMLFGALMEAQPWMQDDNRFVLWEKRYAKAVAALNRTEKRARWGGGPIRTVPDVVA